jgi:hypothetical protein
MPRHSRGRLCHIACLLVCIVPHSPASARSPGAHSASTLRGFVQIWFEEFWWYLARCRRKSLAPKGKKIFGPAGFFERSISHYGKIGYGHRRQGTFPLTGWRSGPTISWQKGATVMPRPADWPAMVNQPTSDAELPAGRRCVVCGAPLGDPDWVQQTARRLGLVSSLRPVGGPRRTKTAMDQTRRSSLSPFSPSPRNPGAC